MIGRPPVDPAMRFGKFVLVTPSCWLWTGTTNKGYGQFWNGSGRTYAHRWSYEHNVGPIPTGMQLDHLCRVRACVNPAHLEPVTARENTLRSEGITAKYSRRDECETHGPLAITGGRRRCLACHRQAQARYRMRRAVA